MKESVTAVLTCEDKFFVIKRKDSLNAFPGYLSFPGGKIDAEDHEATPAGETFAGFPADQINAIIREVQEELEFNLYENPDLIDGITYMGNAISPDFNPIRFNNFYYEIRLKELPKSLNICGHEIEWGKWLTRKEVFSELEKGHNMAVPPTRKVFERIGESGVDQEREIDFTLPYNSKEQVPWIEVIDGVTQFMPLSNTLPPAKRTNCFHIGNMIVDPSPKDEIEYKKLKASLKGFKFDSIFLTHHHGDHHEFSNILARETSSKVYLSEKTKELIERNHGDSYFDYVDVHLVKEGDEIGDYQGKPMRVYELPGHDCGQVGVASSDNGWLLVGDLIQGVGTVVVSSPEGDMQAYFESLQKVIDLKPAIVMPSHGIPLGGVYKVRNTLQHRRMREEQIYAYLHITQDVEEIVEKIYLGLSPKLKKYAHKTVKSHIKKIKAEREI